MAIIDTYQLVTDYTKAPSKTDEAKVIADAINSIEQSQGLAKSTDIAEIKGILKVLVSVNVGIALGIVGLFLQTLQ